MLVVSRMMTHAFVLPPHRQILPATHLIRLQSTPSSTPTSNKTPPQQQQSLDNNNNDKMDKNTMTTITCGDCSITLIGTAHLSASSNAQVKRVIEDVQPHAVMIEMDAPRLPRIGIESVNSIQNMTHIINADSTLPSLLTQQQQSSPFDFFQKIFISLSSLWTRQWLTKAYTTMGESMDAQGGGEFLAAIRAAEECKACHTLLLGDRSSVTTIQRAITIAFKSQDGAWGVWKRLQQVNAQEMEALETTIRGELLETTTDSVTTDGDIQVAMMERLKQDSTFRTRLFAKLEEEVPEFTRAFLNERDYIMGECLRNVIVQNDKDVSRVVAVVGLAHVGGIVQHLEAVFQNETAPLIMLMENEEK